MNSREDNIHSDDQLAMYILDVMRHDEVENVDGIRQLINNTTNIGWRTAWRHDFSDEEIVKGLLILLDRMMIRPLIYDNNLKEIVDWRGSALPPMEMDQMWFRITELGWKKWEQWIPPDEPHIE